jgi:hypothetical protein
MAIRVSDCRIANDPTSAQENVSQFATRTLPWLTSVSLDLCLINALNLLLKTGRRRRYKNRPLPFRIPGVEILGR